ncbi:MAG: hypothetical protein IID44_26060 [Planctomycetes bacterium]|nr:hypothetical protein [Planctomycetota bacterium]
MTTLQQEGHSAQVEIYLHVADRRLRVAQVGPDSMILRDQLDCPPSSAQVSISVDGHEEIHDIWLYEGIGQSRCVRFF